MQSQNENNINIGFVSSPEDFSYSRWFKKDETKLTVNKWDFLLKKGFMKVLER